MTLLHGDSEVEPKCPNCRKELGRWNRIDSGVNGFDNLICPKCGLLSIWKKEDY